MSFDIECAGRKGIFPEAKIDPVIQIASMVTTQGETKPFIRNVMVLNTCAHIVGTHTMSFDQEEKLLAAWADFVRKVDPDVVIGYNTSNFDFPYLLDRAKYLGVNKFPFLGRLNGEQLCSRSWVRPCLRGRRLNDDFWFTWDRCQDGGKGYKVFIQGLRKSREQGHQHGRSPSIGHASSHAS